MARLRTQWSFATLKIYNVTGLFQTPPASRYEWQPQAQARSGSAAVYRRSAENGPIKFTTIIMAFVRGVSVDV